MKKSDSGPAFVVFGGSGAIGRIVVRDLFESSRRNQIAVADFNREAATTYAHRFHSKRITAAQADARDVSELANIIRSHSVVINCTRHQFNVSVMEAAL